MTAVVFDVTSVVLTVKVPVDFPARTETVPDTDAEVEPLVTVTISPPAGAGDVSVIVPVLVLPPFTAVGFSVRDLTLGPLIVRFAD